MMRIEINQLNSKIINLRNENNKFIDEINVLKNKFNKYETLFLQFKIEKGKSKKLIFYI